MISQEEAQERLKAFRDPEREKAIYQRGQKLSKNEKITLLYLMDDIFAKPDIYKNLGSIDFHQARSIACNLSTRERSHVFTTISPRMARHLEILWQFCLRIPYQYRYDAMPFRCPAQADIGGIRALIILTNIIEYLTVYDADTAWLAAWCPYLGYYSDGIGMLCAAVIDEGGSEGEKVFQILRASANGEHEIGAMGKHVVTGLLGCSRRDGWSFIEGMLLAAQRQEGLRQVILESIGDAHPQAFRRMLRLIIEHNLARFSSVLRAVDIWFNFGWTVDNITTTRMNNLLAQVLDLLEKPNERAGILRSGNGESVYLALWATGYENAIKALEAADLLLTDPDPERRYAAVVIIAKIMLLIVHDSLRQALYDPDLRIATAAITWLAYFSSEDYQLDADMGEDETSIFRGLKDNIYRFPVKSTQLPPIIWPWTAQTTRRQQVAEQMSRYLSKNNLVKLLPYAQLLDSESRYYVLDMLKDSKSWIPEIHAYVLSLIGDPSSRVSHFAFEILEKHAIAPDEIHGFENLLTRKKQRSVLMSLCSSASSPMRWPFRVSTGCFPPQIPCRETRRLKSFSFSSIRNAPWRLAGLVSNNSKIAIQICRKRKHYCFKN